MLGVDGWYWYGNGWWFRFLRDAFDFYVFYNWALQKNCDLNMVLGSRAEGVNI